MNEYKDIGLLERFWSLFPKGNGASKMQTDKLVIVELMLWAILILAALRVFDAVSAVYAALDPIARFVVSAVTLALTEGGFVAWRAFRYHPKSNQTQRDAALAGMITSFVASISIGVAEYLARALDGLTISGELISTHEIMVWVVGVAYVVALVGHIICALVAKEFDDDVSATHQENVINQSAQDTKRASRRAQMRAEANADALVNRAEVSAAVMATLAVAPVAAVLGAVSNARKNILDAYGQHVSEVQVSELLYRISGDLPGAIQSAYAGSVRQFLSDPKTVQELGLAPDAVEAAITQATQNMAANLRASLTPGPVSAPAAQQLGKSKVAPGSVSQVQPGAAQGTVVSLTPPPLFMSGGNGNGHIPPP
jgi:hypothetical protein